MKDFYQILGVDRKASETEIKRSYRKLARRFHPDRNPADKQAEERFKEVSEAYEVLSDPEKRKRYDAGGMYGGRGAGFDPSAFGRGGSGGIGDFGDILSNLFGGAGRARRTEQRGRDLETRVHIGFDQAMEGAQVPVAVSAPAPCPACGGTGAEPGSAPKICPHCKGRGMESEGQGLFAISHPCGRCGGAGTVIEKPCKTCNASGATRQVRRYRANIPAGVRDGNRIRLRGKGEAGPRGGQPGDLYVVVGVESSPVFRRRGDDVEVEVPITFVEAARGATVEVPTLKGIKHVRVPAGSRHGKVLRIRGEGPPRLSGRGRGDVRAKLAIDVPMSLTKDQKAALDELARVIDGNPREKLLAGRQ